MNHKKNFANGIVVFFKAMKISAFIGVAVFLLCFFVIYEGNHCINPDEYDIRQEYSFNSGDVIASRNAYGITVYSENSTYHIPAKYLKALDYCNNGHVGWNSRYYSFELIENACATYLKHVILCSLLFGFTAFLGIPTVIILFCIVSSFTKYAKKWVDNNQTIKKNNNKIEKNMGQAKEQLIEIQQEKFDRKLAEYLGISYNEFGMLQYAVHEDSSNEGMIYNYILDFSDETNPKEILSKIKSLDDNYQVWIDVATFEYLSREPEE